MRAGAGLVLLAIAQISVGAGAAEAQLTRTPATLRFGPQRPDLVRYNRVEGLSLGVRGQLRPATPVGPLSLSATARLGTGDWHVYGELEAVHETLDRRLVWSAYHELAALDEGARHLGPVNSLMALLYGQDDGDYYRRSGGALEWTPPSARPQELVVRVFAEYHEGVDKETNFQLPRLWDEDKAFRPNLRAEDGWDIGASIRLASRFGLDPNLPSQSLTAFAQATAEYWRASFGYDTTLPLPARMHVVLGGEVGGAGGTLTPQRLWYLGGYTTLRGYEPRALAGTRFYRGRIELDKAFPFGRILVFADGGWAGGRGREESRAAAGAGIAFIDGIVRADVARPFQGSHRLRLDVYLDTRP